MNPIYDDAKQQILEAVKRIGLLLPRQAPIRDFVSQNKLEAYQHLPFAAAMETAEAVSGIHGYLPESEFRAFFHAGRITEADLQTLFDRDEVLGQTPPLASTASGVIRKRDVWRVAMLYGVDATTAADLNWQIRQYDCLRRFQADVPAKLRGQIIEKSSRHLDRPGLDEAEAVAGLWKACLDVFELSHLAMHPEELTDLSRSQAETILGEFNARTEEAGRVDSKIHLVMRSEERAHLRSYLGDVGSRHSFRDLLSHLTGRDLLQEVRPALIRILASHLDEGLAPWHAPERALGLYAAWKANAGLSFSLGLANLQGWRQALEALPEDPADAAVSLLRQMDIPEDHWADYLNHLAWETPGWAGMVNWREGHAAYSARLKVPVSLVDFFVIRLFLDKLWSERICQETWGIAGNLDSLAGYFEKNVSEFFVRHHVYTDDLPEYLTISAQRLIGLRGSERGQKEQWRVLADMIWTWQHSPMAEAGQASTVYRSAWRLFRLAQHLGLAAHEVRGLGLEAALALLGALDQATPNWKGYRWLAAYEHHYREMLFGALVQNHRGPAAADRRPDAQMVFCMDDREESIRRHLEEVNPAIETFGVAGFFGVAIRWQGIDDHEASTLCPLPVNPVHEIHEIPMDEAAPAWERRRLGQAVAGLVKTLFRQHSRHHPLASPLLVALLAPLAFANLVGRIVLPSLHEQLRRKLASDWIPDLATRLTLQAGDNAPAATVQHPRLGFTAVEQADRIEGMLRAIGLTANFAPLVVLAGHGASSQNNPHYAAYDCGACSGRHGGPNARVFAAMANDPAIRALLAARGLAIPDDTWFIGTEHNTTSEEFLWFDLDALPTQFQSARQKLADETTQAIQLAAHERCRRFASAPADLSPAKAFRHVIERSIDISQARPELGHACNAAAVIGRRHATRGVFFDRRLFLISYDPLRDPEGKILENILLAAGPVGAGINLEYFFSKMNNEAFGAGSKAQHNATGLFGVMEGSASDLRTGFPRQMIELHEPMRLQMVVEAETATLEAIYQRQPALRELIGNEWLLLSALNPASGAISVFEAGHGFRRWRGAAKPLPSVARSRDWYAGHAGTLPPAFTTATCCPEHRHVA